MNLEKLEQELAELPLYIYFFMDPKDLEFSDRVRWICEHECAQYGKSWACPPGVGTVEQCAAHCRSFNRCLVISTVTEVADIADIQETLSTRQEHEEITDQVAALLRQCGAEPFVLSTESCAICPRCAILDGKSCRFPEKMHPCVESQGINVIPVLEQNGLEFQYGQNVVTWISMLLFRQ
ncbi:MAG: DUF2284 domain-containing protein [Candidatus Faecousia sp.]|nr:DUF2284 domain-containing protein [Candidatus Faecousia sp.]